MRITSNMMTDNSLYNIQQGRARLDKLQELISSGNNVNRPSDDPATAKYLYDINDRLKSGEQHLSNINKSMTWQKITDTALTGMEDTLQLARDVANTITNGTSDVSMRRDVVSQLTAIKQQLIDMGNSQIGDQYIFGGAQNAAPPFTNVVSPPALSTDYYTGDETALNVEVGNNTTLQMNIPGNQLLTGSTSLVAPPDPLPYGSTNILKAFDDLIAAVNSNNVTDIQTGAQALYDGSKQITNARSDVASRMLRLDSSAKINENIKNTLETIFGNTQNVDYAKLGVELNQQKTAFEASLSTSAQVSQMSLLDYLR